MRRSIKTARAASLLLLVAGLATLGMTSVASAHTGNFAKFDYCPSTTAGVKKCLVSVTTGGKVVLGKKNVPIVNPVTLQGGVGVPNEATGVATFFGATNGVTLSKAPQPVPGGLAGIIPPESSPQIVKDAIKFFFENGLTGVNSTLELARPASEIRVNEEALLYEEGTALKMPVKVHLENPFLGSNCYVGSSSNPIIWNLTSGKTSPPAGTEPIFGTFGFGSFIEEEIFHISGNELVENNWSAPGATGCGGFLLELLINPIINASVGIPAAAGKNTAVLKNTIDLATAVSVNNH